MKTICPTYLILLLLVGAGGCQADNTGPNEDELRLEEQREKFTKSLERYAQSLAVRGTIGEATWIEGMRKMDVRGYGLVVGLGNQGSRTCPERIRRELAAEIRKSYRLGDSRIGLGHLRPEAMIDSPDTAVVLVRGEIGAAALSGAKFDLNVRALEGTETASLEGGKLYSCDLRYYRAAAPGTVQEGSVLARGKGAVFVNPFGLAEDSATPVNPRTARVINGGTSIKSRRVQLTLYAPSYALARVIQDRINSRYGMGQRIASATTPSKVALDIPQRYAGRELDFLALIRHTYVMLEGGALDRRALELAEEILDAQAPHDSIALAWEAIGKTVKPVIRNLYTNERDFVNYFAARTGLRLKDRLAVQVLANHATDPQSLYHMEAIRELGEAVEVSKAARSLLEVVSSDLDPRARILAYEGLAKHFSAVVRTEVIGKQFVVDEIRDIDGPALIYAQIVKSPRLAIIGNPRLRTPMFYRHSRGLITMNAAEGARTIGTLRRTLSGRVSPTVQAPLDVFEFIRLLGSRAGEDKYGQVVGLGLGYSQVVEVLAALCTQGSINAEFRLQDPDEITIASPERLGGRPESEL